MVRNPKILNTSISVRKRRIVLTRERWLHIIKSHNYMVGESKLVLDVIKMPDFIVRGTRGELLAVRLTKTSLGDKHMVVVYRETFKQGFIITAFVTSNVSKLRRRGVIWRRC